MANPDYSPQEITLALIRKVSKWNPPETPKEIRDKKQKLILRHQPSGYLALYVELGRGKRERVCNVQELLNTYTELTWGAVRRKAAILRGDDAGGRDFQKERQAARAIPTLETYLDDKTEGAYGWWLIYNRKDGKNILDRINCCFSKYNSRKLDELTPEIIDAWRTRRLKNKVKRETINRDVGALRSALSKAVEWKMLTKHPLQNFKPLQVDKKKKSYLAFTDKELKHLRQGLEQREEKIRAKRESGNKWRDVRGYESLPSLQGVYVDALLPAVEISLNTGLRRDELFTLMWEFIDFKKKTIHIEGEETKAYETRTIPLNAAVIKILRQWQLQQGRPTSGYVFPGEVGRITSLRKAFYKVIEDAGVERVKPKGRLTWHSLRHTFGTQLGYAGVDIQTIKELMGHSEIETTQQYLHTDKDRKKSAVESLADGY